MRDRELPAGNACRPLPIILIRGRARHCRYLYSEAARSLVGQAHGIEIPGGVRQPLLGPAPVLILPGGGKALVICDTVFVIPGGGNAVDDGSGRIGVLPGAEEHIRGVAVTAAD